MKKNSPEATYSAVILAGDRGPADPVLQARPAPCKALVPVAGRAMVLRVLDTLDSSACVADCLLVGPPRQAWQTAPELSDRIGRGDIAWIESAATPSTSAFAALATFPRDRHILLTTADHALLTGEMVGHFCRAASTSGCDVVAGVARHDLVAAAFPATRRTVTRLRDGGVCGCNLFAFLTPEGRYAATFWRRVESQRKQPLRLAGSVGWGVVLRYLLGRLTLEQGLQRLSAKMGLRAGVVEMPFPAAAVDVDKPDDLSLVEDLLGRRAADAGP